MEPRRSTLGAFGPSTPKDGTPQVTIQRPTSMYGVTKVSGELLCDYYSAKFGVDARGVRYPGIISNVTLPGGGPATSAWLSSSPNKIDFTPPTTSIISGVMMPKD